MCVVLINFSAALWLGIACSEMKQLLAEFLTEDCVKQITRCIHSEAVQANIIRQHIYNYAFRQFKHKNTQ